MTEELPIQNRVAASALLTLDPADFYPQGPRRAIDVADQLHMRLLLKEKDFRLWIRQHDWTQYQDCYVAIHCSEEAIVPTWAYMLVSLALAPYARHAAFATPAELEALLFQQALALHDWTQYRDRKVVVKGCGPIPVPVYAYADIARRLQAVAASVMYGEPCSTVPLYKRTN